MSGNLFDQSPAATASSPLESAVLSVTQLNQQARLLLERQFAVVLVAGEISGLKVSSGHRYFNLKDDQSTLPAVLFRREATRLRFAVENGMQVIATGKLTLYAPYGRYQLVVDRLEPCGAGALQAAFEQLKARLDQEGLFAAERKRPLPRLITRVGVVTSPTGAVIRDIVNVAIRRFPNAQILVIPTRVQGAEVASEIAAAITRASSLAASLDLQALIVARGGGSLEDLWGFNDERVARAIAAASVPVVSAVGHETDFTIADFVADRRAPTPSAAAELVFPIKSELIAEIRRPVQRSGQALRRQLEARYLRLQAQRARLGDGRAPLRDAMQRAEYAHARIVQATRQAVSVRRLRLQRIETRLARAHPRVRLQMLRGRVQQAAGRLVLLGRQRLRADRQCVASLGRRLDALSPLGVLDRGYGIVLGPDGRALRDAAAVGPGDELDIRVARGRLRATVVG